MFCIIYCFFLQGVQIHTALFFKNTVGLSTHNLIIGAISNVIGTSVGTQGSGSHSFSSCGATGATGATGVQELQEYRSYRSTGATGATVGLNAFDILFGLFIFTILTKKIKFHELFDKFYFNYYQYSILLSSSNLVYLKYLDNTCQIFSCNAFLLLYLV